jgi:CHAT domain-containing protein
VGDIDFFKDKRIVDPDEEYYLRSMPREVEGLKWKALPHTKAEVEVIADHFSKLPKAQVKFLSGNNATAEELEREITKHRYLHLATHGFFAQPKFVRQLQEASGDKLLIPVLPPGLSSGIVCAGVNNTRRATNGILTAAQIAALNLGGVELAVLSACETGLGELAGGEGVLGLQRAFQIAGARSTITSLWAIPDLATAELMKRMYANHLKGGMSAADAMREAQLWVLNNGDKVGAFDVSQRPGKRTPPKFWAAFTFAGDWR